MIAQNIQNVLRIPAYLSSKNITTGSTQQTTGLATQDIVCLKFGSIKQRETLPNKLKRYLSEEGRIFDPASGQRFEHLMTSFRALNEEIVRERAKLREYPTTSWKAQKADQALIQEVYTLTLKLCMQPAARDTVKPDEKTTHVQVAPDPPSEEEMTMKMIMESMKHFMSWEKTSKSVYTTNPPEYLNDQEDKSNWNRFKLLISLLSALHTEIWVDHELLGSGKKNPATGEPLGKSSDLFSHEIKWEQDATKLAKILITQAQAPFKMQRAILDLLEVADSDKDPTRRIRVHYSKIYNAIQELDPNAPAMS